MGACEFWQTGTGKDAADAFRRAVERARWEHGHGRYTGTLAEKDSFVEVKVAPGVDPVDVAKRMLDDDDPRVSDKWGPAGCVELPRKPDDTERRFLFFGWASS